jgi:alpha-tubulin suppressor-like RCC1 family protein
MACGSGNVVFITTNGVYGLGANSFGELGIGSLDYAQGIVKELSLSQILSETKEKVVQVSCGDHNIVVLTDQGHVYVTGYCLVGAMPYQEPISASGGHLVKFARVDIPSRFKQVTCSFYNFCFITNENDLWVSRGLGDITHLFGFPDESYYGISGDHIKLHRIEQKRVVQRFESAVKRVVCGSSQCIAITESGDVFITKAYAATGTLENAKDKSDMKKLRPEMLRDITYFGYDIQASMGDHFCAIYTTGFAKTYSKKLYAQATASNPFIDLIIN